MLESIRLKNFQRHKDLMISFDPKITTLTGPSDSGKSAVLRALRWVATNRPRGTSFIRRGQKRTDVSVWIDGHRVDRRRGKGVNTYRVDGKMLKSFGTGVPEEVDRLLNLGAENHQGQHDPPFWFCLSPGDVAKELNRIVDLTLVDSVTSCLSSRLRQAKAEATVLDGQVAEQEKRLEGLLFVDEMDEEFKVIVDLNECMEREEQEREQLSLLLCEISAVESLVKREVPDISDLEAAREEAGRDREQCEEMRSMMTSVIDAAVEVDSLRAELEAAERELERQSKGRCPVCGRPLDV